MKHKPIRLDWDELEVAFTNHDEEIVYYLDLVTGKVIIDGEGEDDDFDDEEDFSPNSLVAAGQSTVRDDSTRAYVKPMATEMKLEWMNKFLNEKDNGLDKEANASLKKAFESDDAPEALGAFLRSADEARDVWYLYRSDRLHEYMQSWLGEREIKPIDSAPWA